MRSLILAIVFLFTTFLIVGMGNDAQAACNAACQAKKSKLNENPAEARRNSETCHWQEDRERFIAIHGRVMTTMERDRWRARCGCWGGVVAGGLCYDVGGRGP
jgi:hypothetical protein